MQCDQKQKPSSTEDGKSGPEAGKEFTMRKICETSTSTGVTDGESGKLIQKRVCITYEKMMHTFRC